MTHFTTAPGLSIQRPIASSGLRILVGSSIDEYSAAVGVQQMR